jgi:hypothetical protein
MLLYMQNGSLIVRLACIIIQYHPLKFDSVINIVQTIVVVDHSSSDGTSFSCRGMQTNRTSDGEKELGRRFRTVYLGMF